MDSPCFVVEHHLVRRMARASQARDVKDAQEGRQIGGEQLRVRARELLEEEWH